MAENNLIFSENVLPHNIQAEQGILGSVLADPSILPVVVENIKTEYFYSPQHREIYSVILRMFSVGETADVITVLNEVEKLRIFESSESCRKYLASLADRIPTTANIESYCKIVADKYYIRSLAIAAREIISEIQIDSTDAQRLIDSAEQKIYDIRQGKNVEGLVPIKLAINEAYDRLGKIAGPDKEKYIGARTGFANLDTLTSGLNKSDLIIVAARPGMGKTSFAMNIAVNVAKHSSGKEVAVFSLEMSREQLASRLLSSEAQIDSHTLRSGNIPDNDWIKIATAAGYLSNLPIYIDDTGGITVQQMKAKLRRRKNVGLVVIDYLQLMESSSKSENRAVVVAEITRQITIMAKEFDVPVILLSQLSRNTEQRTDKRPQLSDLRESGAIEQDADIVLFLYREAYYKEEENKNIAQCIVAKNRHGEQGKVDMYWDGRYTRFSDLNKTAVE